MQSGVINLANGCQHYVREMTTWCGIPAQPNGADDIHPHGRLHKRRHVEEQDGTFDSHYGHSSRDCRCGPSLLAARACRWFSAPSRLDPLCGSNALDGGLSVALVWVWYRCSPGKFSIVLHQQLWTVLACQFR